MNRTEAIKAHRLSASMVTGLESARYNEHEAKREDITGYLVYELHPRTRKALHDRGLMEGHYYLTREGVNVLAALAGNKVDAAQMSANGVVHLDDMPSEPDFNAEGVSECYFGCGSHVVAVFVDYVGRTEGLCATHRVRVDGETYDIPAVPQTDAESIDDTQEESTMEKLTDTVMVIQNIAGTNGMNHYHAPECRDIQREQRRYGQRKGDAFIAAFSSVAAIIRHEYDDVCDGEAEYMVSEANSEDFGVKIMPCLSIPKGELDGRPVEFVNGEWRLGIALDTEEQISTRTAEERYPMDSHLMVKDDRETRERVGAWSGYVVGHGARPFTSAPGTRPWWIPTVVIERGDGSTRTFMVGDVEPYKSLDEFMTENEDNDPGNAGFEETDSVPLADWEIELLEGVENSRSTGTTHHSMTSDGKQWERFEHTLNVGDVVKGVGMQGVYEVHALIPGLDMVYVLGTVGEPFPVAATKLYTL